MVLCETKQNETKWYFAKRYFAKRYFAKRYFAKWYFAKWSCETVLCEMVLCEMVLCEMVLCEMINRNAPVTGKATLDLRPLYVHAVLNSVMLPQIFLHAQHFLPDKFFSLVLLL